MKEFKKGDKVTFAGEIFSFISYYTYKTKFDFVVIWNGKIREIQPIQFVEKA